jgi:hypothetical protein
MRLFSFVLVIILVLSSISPLAHAQQDYIFIDLPGYSWNKTTLNALVVTSENEIWWKPNLVNLIYKSIQQWNEAFQFFAAKYPDYAYLSSLSITGAVSNETLLGYDIYVRFSDSITIGGQQALGLATTYSNVDKIIENCSIILSSKSGTFDLTGSHQRDVANHELGHALGLGHSNSTADLMYPTYDLFSTDNAISTLNLYGVAILFNWIISPSNYSIPSFTTLPSNIAFEYAPVSEPEPKGLSDNILYKSLAILLNSPYMAIMIVTLVFFIIVVSYVYRGTRRRNNHYITNRLELVRFHTFFLAKTVNMR